MEEIEVEEQEPIHGTEEIVKKESFYHQALSEDLIVHHSVADEIVNIFKEVFEV